MVREYTITRLGSKAEDNTETIKLDPEITIKLYPEIFDTVDAIVKCYINHYNPNAFGIYRINDESTGFINDTKYMKDYKFVFIIKDFFYILQYENEISKLFYVKNNYIFKFNVLRNTHKDTLEYSDLNNWIDDNLSDIKSEAFDVEFIVENNDNKTTTTTIRDIKIPNTSTDEEPVTFEEVEESVGLEFFLRLIKKDRRKSINRYSVKLLQNIVVTEDDPEVMDYKKIGDDIVLIIEYHVNDYPILTNLILDLDFMGLYSFDTFTNEIVDVLPCNADKDAGLRLKGYKLSPKEDTSNEEESKEDEAIKNKLSAREDRSTKRYVYCIYNNWLLTTTEYELKNLKGDEFITLKTVFRTPEVNYRIQRNLITTMEQKLHGAKENYVVLD